MSNKLLTEPEILALLSEEIPPESNQRWHRTDNRQRWMLWRDDVSRLLVAYSGIASWSVGWEDGIRGHGDDIQAAIADFRRQLLADAVAVGAVPKVNPTSDYNDMETAIYVAAFVAQLPKWECSHDAARIAATCVEYYRATINNP